MRYFAALLLLALPLAAYAQQSVTEYNDCIGAFCECWTEPSTAQNNYGASSLCANPNADPPSENLAQGSVAAAPEIDPAGALGALTLLAGILSIFRAHRRKTAA